MKHTCVIALVLLCVVPVLLWPTEEASLAEEGFEVAGRHPRAIRSTRPTSSGRKSSVPVERKGSAHHTTHSSAHHSKITKKTKLNRPTKPGKKHVPRHHQQKKHKKTTDSKSKSEKSSAKANSHKDKERKSEE